MAQTTKRPRVRTLLLSAALFLGAGTAHAADSTATAALREATRLAEAGQYEEALQKHIWFHNHALEVDKSNYGVRLSFALDYWIELGAKYPKALEALKGIRDEKSTRLLAGEGDGPLFHDVQSINDHLGESQATVELLKKLDSSHPDLVRSLGSTVPDVLVNGREYALARKYLGDPGERLARAREMLEHHRKDTGEHAEPMLRSRERLFTKEVVRLITVLNETGDRQRALEIQAEALKALDRPEIREAVKP